MTREFDVAVVGTETSTCHVVHAVAAAGKIVIATGAVPRPHGTEEAINLLALAIAERMTATEYKETL